ncbi:MAG: 30S ribosomal protein S5, partial [Candidatus Nanoarchaeia archaeon]|nr:30S ribosomal protein S5 [Candidatus Nanoarchaeia archaeon]
VRIILKPAARGTGILSESQVGIVLGLAGIKDLHTKATGQTRTKLNLIRACFAALKELTIQKYSGDIVKENE